jgi:hypothetical protein
MLVILNQEIDQYLFLIGNTYLSNSIRGGILSVT